MKKYIMRSADRGQVRRTTADTGAAARRRGLLRPVDHLSPDQTGSNYRRSHGDHAPDGHCLVVSYRGAGFFLVFRDNGLRRRTCCLRGDVEETGPTAQRARPPR